MTQWLLILGILLAAGPTDTLLELRQAVREAATEVDDAKDRRVDKDEIARLMAHYRSLAEQLEAEERKLSLVDEMAVGRLAARADLAQAIAEGREANHSRTLLMTRARQGPDGVAVAVVETAEEVLKRLDEKFNMAQKVMVPSVRKGYILDVGTELQMLMLVLKYDIEAAEHERSRLTVRLSNQERRSSSGQQRGMRTTVIEARRIKDYIEDVETERERIQSLYARGAGLQTLVKHALEQTP